MVAVVVGAGGEIFFRAVRVVAHGDSCEPLLGTDFCVQATLRGDLGPTGRVVDFYAVDAALRQFCDALHKRVLIPLDNPALAVRRDGALWQVAHRSRQWAFPACDVTTLEVVNPTHEALAGLALEALCRALRDHPEMSLVHRIELAVYDREGSATVEQNWTTTTPPPVAGV